MGSYELEPPSNAIGPINPNQSSQHIPTHYSIYHLLHKATMLHYPPGPRSTVGPLTSSTLCPKRRQISTERRSNALRRVTDTGRPGHLVTCCASRTAKKIQRHVVESTLQGINISHLGKRKIIFKSALVGDMLVPWRVSFGGDGFSRIEKIAIL